MQSSEAYISTIISMILYNHSLLKILVGCIPSLYAFQFFLLSDFCLSCFFIGYDYVLR